MSNPEGTPEDVQPRVDEHRVDEHRVGIIGLGAVGRRFVEQFGGHPRFELAAVWDIDEGARSRAVADFGAPVVDSVDELLDDPTIDIVYIAVPPLFHETYVDQVVARGKTTFCEKPLGVNDAQSAAMVDRVRAADAPAAVNFVFGSAPSATELAARLDAGQAGTVKAAELRLHFERWPRPFQAEALWLRDRDQGGWVREVVSHFVFLAERLFGSGRLVSSHPTYPGDGTAEQGLVAAVMCGDVPLTIVGTSDSPGADEVEFIVWGTDASYRISNWYQLRTAMPADDGEWVDIPTGEAAGGPGPYEAQLDQVAALCERRPNTLSTFDEALRVQVLVEAMLR